MVFTGNIRESISRQSLHLNKPHDPCFFSNYVYFTPRFAIISINYLKAFPHQEICGNLLSKPTRLFSSRIF